MSGCSPTQGGTIFFDYEKEVIGEQWNRTRERERQIQRQRDRETERQRDREKERPRQHHDIPNSNSDLPSFSLFLYIFSDFQRNSEQLQAYCDITDS